MPFTEVNLQRVEKSLVFGTFKNNRMVGLRNPVD